MGHVTKSDFLWCFLWCLLWCLTPFVDIHPRGVEENIK
jgi:hypothetical protein